MFDYPRPYRRQPTRLSCPWDSPDKNTGVGCHFLLQCMKVKEGLKLNIHKTKIMASGPSTLWQTDGETMETVTDFISLDSKITVDSDCSHKIKRCLLLGKNAVTKLDSVLKIRGFILPSKICIVKLWFFQ